MKKFIAYTQKDFNAEKFYIEEEEGVKAIIKAENSEDAEKEFKSYIHETSLYSYEETEKWIKNNPLYVIEYKEGENN